MNNPPAILHDFALQPENLKPILGYWNIRGLAAQIRYMFAYCKVDFDDVMYDCGTPGTPQFRANWLNTK